MTTGSGFGTGVYSSAVWIWQQLNNEFPFVYLLGLGVAGMAVAWAVRFLMRKV